MSSDGKRWRLEDGGGRGARQNEVGRESRRVGCKKTGVEVGCWG